MFFVCFLQSTEPLENHTTVMKMGILEIVSSSSSRALSSVLNVSAVLEEELVLDNLGGFVNVFIVLFWIIVFAHPRVQQGLKGIVYPEMNILSLITYPHVIPNLKTFVHLQKTN